MTRITDEQARAICQDKEACDAASKVRLALDLLDARRDNAALVDRNLVLTAKLRGVRVVEDEGREGE